MTDKKIKIVLHTYNGIDQDIVKLFYDVDVMLINEIKFRKIIERVYRKFIIEYRRLDDLCWNYVPNHSEHTKWLEGSDFSINLYFAAEILKEEYAALYRMNIDTFLVYVIEELKIIIKEMYGVEKVDKVYS